MNAVADFTFAFTSLVSWPIALTMAAGSIAGGYVGPARRNAHLSDTCVTLSWPSDSVVESGSC